MPRTESERAMIERFERRYELTRADVLLEIERAACGCDYGATSWTTLDEARAVAGIMALAPGKRLLEVGAGSGWPGLFLAQSTGCDVALIDLPLSGLRAARERAAADRIAGACWFAVADGAAMPFPDCWFDAVFHSDVLCCLPEKLAVLKACRRAVRAGGRMVFSVIFVSPGLSAAERERAVASGPPFIETETPYEAMLRATGWRVTSHADLTAEYLATLNRMIDMEKDFAGGIETLLGAAEAAQMWIRRQAAVAALEDGLLRRELFGAVPIGGDA